MDRMIFLLDRLNIFPPQFISQAADGLDFNAGTVRINKTYQRIHGQDLMVFRSVTASPNHILYYQFEPYPLG